MTDRDAREDGNAGVERRKLLKGAGFAAIVGLAGCLAPAESREVNTTTEDAAPVTTSAGSSHRPASVDISLSYSDSYVEGHNCRIVSTVESWNDDHWLVMEIDNSTVEKIGVDGNRVYGLHKSEQSSISGKEYSDSEVNFYADGEEIVVATVDTETGNYTNHLSGTVRIDDSEETCEVVEV